MKKITYMLAGVLLVALVLPVHAEKKKEKKGEVSNPAMLSVCQWAAGRNISANEGVISTCAELGVNLGAKPAGAPSIMSAAELKARFEQASDDAQDAWEKYLAAKAAVDDLKKKLGASQKDLLSETAKAVSETCIKESVCPEGSGDMVKHLTDAEGLKAEMNEKFKQVFKDELAKIADLRKDGKKEEADKLEAEINKKWQGSSDYKKYTDTIAKHQDSALATANNIAGESGNGQSYYDAVSAAVSNSSAVQYYTEVVAVQSNPDPYTQEADANYQETYEAYKDAAKAAAAAGTDAGVEYIPPHQQESEEAKK